MSQSPYTVVDELEKRIADWVGAPYGVAVESCSAAIFLCLQYLNIDGRWDGLTVTIPKRTYPSIGHSIKHARMKINFADMDWEGEYELAPTNIWDAALRFRKNMYHGGMQCISGHIKKRLNVGRMGMILLDDKDAYQWFRRARFDGRNPIPLQEDIIEQTGWNLYLSPSDAARAIQIFEVIKDKDLPDLPVSEQKYSDLSIQPAFK